jgi:hypothetical protein
MDVALQCDLRRLRFFDFLVVASQPNPLALHETAAAAAATATTRIYYLKELP